MRRVLTLLTAAAVIAAPAASSGQKPKPKPPKYGEIPTVTIAGSPNPTVFPAAVAITGRVRDRGRGVAVTLQGRTVRERAFTTLARTTTRNNGRYRFGHRPRLNTTYRVLAATTPAVQSRDLLVRVRMLVGLRVSDSTPRVGARVRFFGIVQPPHNKRRAYIQKRSPSGRFVTVARTRLRRLDAQSSRYSRRIRVRRTGVYRVRVLGHLDHAMGISRTRRLVTH